MFPISLSLSLDAKVVEFDMLNTEPDEYGALPVVGADLDKTHEKSNQLKEHLTMMCIRSGLIWAWLKPPNTHPLKGSKGFISFSGWHG